MINKDYEFWENIYGNFECEFPRLAEDAVSWHPAGHNEIVIQYRNGRRDLYNVLLSSGRLRTIYDPNRKDLHVFTEERWSNEFGKNLDRKIKAMAITNDSLSQLTGISRISISKYINGKAIPNTRNCQLIARALKCSVNELIPDYDDFTEEN